MEIRTTHAPHLWDRHGFSAQILRSWVRETQGALPAWTPPAVANAYVALLSAVEQLVQVTQAAAREETRHG